MKLNRIIALTLIMGAGIFSACAKEMRNAVLSFSGNDLQTGDSITEEIFASSKITLVNIWGTFCSPCKAELPDLEELYQNTKKDGINITGILCDAFNNSDYNVKEVKKILKEKGVTYTNILISPETVWLNKIEAVPTSFLVDKDGRIIGRPIIGTRSAGEYKRLIESALKTQE